MKIFEKLYIKWNGDLLRKNAYLRKQHKHYENAIHKIKWQILQPYYNFHGACLLEDDRVVDELIKVVDKCLNLKDENEKLNKINQDLATRIVELESKLNEKCN